MTRPKFVNVVRVRMQFCILSSELRSKWQSVTAEGVLVVEEIAVMLTYYRIT